MDINTALTQDKLLHFTYGSLVAQPVVAMTRALPAEYKVAVGLIAGLIVGAGKEMYDVLVRRTTFSLGDMAATALGGMFTGLMG